MSKMRKKSDLPTKICIECQRPFIWRRSLSRVWNEVLYCSERCRKEKKRSRGKDHNFK